MTISESDPHIHHLVQWASAQPLVRAMLLTSTRARPGSSVDRLSDYDVILVVSDIHPFNDDRSWLDAFSEVMVGYWDPVHPSLEHGIEQLGNVIQFMGGLKIDFSFWPAALMRRIVEAPDLLDELDMGYTILLDKDGVTTGLREPSYTAFIPKRPTNEEYQLHINDFLSDPPYVAKCLWRDELLPAKWCLDTDMIQTYLLRMLEWRAECDQGWSKPVGNLGKGLKKLLPADLWAMLEASHAGASLEDNWEALFVCMALFRRAGIEVGTALGYTYPVEMDDRVRVYCEEIRGMDRGR
jgi:aminoglycoside 6-adenylyltransferase